MLNKCPADHCALPDAQAGYRSDKSSGALLLIQTQILKAERAASPTERTESLTCAHISNPLSTRSPRRRTGNPSRPFLLRISLQNCMGRESPAIFRVRLCRRVPLPHKGL